MYFIGRVLSGITYALTIFAGVAIMVMMLNISADVIGRYFFNEPLPATISIVSNYYMVIAAFIPLALCQKRDSHISVEVVMQLFPQAVQRHAYRWAWLYSAAVFAMLTWTSWIQAESKRSAGTYVMEMGAKVPIWPGYYMLPIGFGLITAILIYQFVIYLTGGKSGLGDTDPWNRGDSHFFETI